MITEAPAVLENNSRIHLLANTYAVYDPWFGYLNRPEIELDLGCGKGSFTLDLARRFPERLILGTDIMVGRLRRVEHKIERAGLRNVELLRADSDELVAYQLPDGCVRRLHLLCPDPWPKDRHRRNRLVTTTFLTRVARILQAGGILHLATDHQPYLESWQRTVSTLPFFVQAPAGISDIGDIKTDFERRWEKQGKSVRHLVYRLDRELN